MQLDRHLGDPLVRCLPNNGAVIRFGQDEADPAHDCPSDAQPLPVPIRANDLVDNRRYAHRLLLLDQHWNVIDSFCQILLDQGRQLGSYSDSQIPPLPSTTMIRLSSACGGDADSGRNVTWVSFFNKMARPCLVLDNKPWKSSFV